MDAASAFLWIAVSGVIFALLAIIKKLWPPSNTEKESARRQAIYDAYDAFVRANFPAEVARIEIKNYLMRGIVPKKFADHFDSFTPSV